MHNYQQPVRTDTFYRFVIEGRLKTAQMDRAEICAHAFTTIQIVQAIVIRAIRALARADWPVRQWFEKELHGKEGNGENTGLLTAVDVSKQVKRSKKRVYEAARIGELRSIRVGGNIRFRPEDVRRWIEHLEQDT